MLSYSITWLAVANSVSGMVRPSALAVLRFDDEVALPHTKTKTLVPRGSGTQSNSLDCCNADATSAVGQKRGFERAPETSAIASIATQSLHRGNRRCGPNSEVKEPLTKPALSQAD